MTNPYAPPSADVHDVVPPLPTMVRAERLTRLGAAILDGIIALVLIYLPMLLTGALTTDNPEQLDPVIVLVGASATLIGAIVWAVLSIRFVQANGQSIGKKIVGIKVVRSDGTRATLGRIFWLRNFVNWLLSLTQIYAIVDVLFIFSQSQQ